MQESYGAEYAQQGLQKILQERLLVDLDRATQLLGSCKAGQHLLDKTREKNKKKWGKRKAGAHHASAKINFNDLSSASDASFSDVSGLITK